MDQSPPGRLTRLAVAACLALLAGCVGQQPPERAPLPEVAAVVEPGRACAFVTGEGTGVVIDEVIAGSAAEGLLEPGDVVVGLDGGVVASTADVFAILAGKAVGEVVALEVERGGTRRPVSLTLAANPDQPSRPRIGIAVVTRFEEIEPAALPAGTELGVHARLVEVDGGLYGLDPVAAAAVPAGSVPAGQPWFALGGVIYRLEGAGSPAARIVGDDGTAIEITDEGVVPYQVIGTVEDSLLVGLAGPDESVYLARVVPSSPPRTVWSVAVEEAAGVPGAAFPSPDGSRILLVGFAPGGEGPFRLRVLDAGSGEEVAGEETLGASGPAVVFGWFDDERVVVQGREGGLALLTVSAGTEEAVQLRVAVGEGDRLFPVGDGVHLLVVRRFEMLRIGLDDGVETRRLITRCDVGAVGLPGSAS